MATFSINQVRHFYVASSTNTIEHKLSEDNSTLRFKYESPGGDVGSDIIDVDKIMYATYTSASDMQYKLKRTTIAVESAIAGYEYVVKVFFTNYAGAGDDNITVKYGMAVAESTDTAALAEALGKSLKANLKDLINLADVSVSGSNIVIIEKVQDWEAGVMPFHVIPFTVSVLPAVKDGTESPTKWAELTHDTGEAVGNAKKIADMEWFYSGARGDMYRGYGHPHGVKTKLVADGTTNYDTLDIHYYYTGPNEGAQKSEKTITIAGTAATLKTINNALATLKVPGVSTIS